MSYNALENDSYAAAKDFDPETAYNYWELGTIPEGKNAYSISGNKVGRFKSFTP
ncbi:MAG: hypothetical protein IIZ59_01365 [Clostridia bacterium]|nr:hypothetical protein [Clostridia bacterium]